VVIVDQRELPHRYVERELRTPDEVAAAIRTLAVRGAPAIGIAGAMAVALAARQLASLPLAAFREQLALAAAVVRRARPTAVNLAWAVDRLLALAMTLDRDPHEVAARLAREATAILEEDRAMCSSMGELALALLREPLRVLTHCNTGALATGGIGTALAAVYLAHGRGMDVQVYACETRPLLQGSRLTCWELTAAGVPVTLITDSMAAWLMRCGMVTACLVGADRVAANGDVANKIGTYGLALLARAHHIPFYVVAPSSSIDASTPDGSRITIEERGPDEVRSVLGHQIAPPEVDVWNPAFDVTPASLVTALVTERGIYRPPFDFGKPEAAVVSTAESA
jgi:methylthioribose-1-phosphate isomerase